MLSEACAGVSSWHEAMGQICTFPSNTVPCKSGRVANDSFVGWAGHAWFFKCQTWSSFLFSTSSNLLLFKLPQRSVVIICSGRILGTVTKHIACSVGAIKHVACRKHMPESVFKAWKVAPPGEAVRGYSTTNGWVLNLIVRVWNLPCLTVGIWGFVRTS